MYNCICYINIRNINFQSQTNVHLNRRLLALSAWHLLETTTATMMTKMAELEALRKSLHSPSTAAVVGVMPTRLVFKTRSLEPDSGNRSFRHFVRQRTVALKVSLKALTVA